MRVGVHVQPGADLCYGTAASCAWAGRGAGWKLGGHCGLLGQVLAGHPGDLLLELSEFPGGVGIAEDVLGVEPVDAVGEISDSCPFNEVARWNGRFIPQGRHVAIPVCGPRIRRWEGHL